MKAAAVPHELVVPLVAPGAAIDAGRGGDGGDFAKRPVDAVAHVAGGFFEIVGLHGWIEIVFLAIHFFVLLYKWN